MDNCHEPAMGKLKDLGVTDTADADGVAPGAP